MYVLFSSGVDSQIITRVFLDNNIDCEFIFLNSVGHCEYELSHIKECEKFYGIKVRIIDIDLEQHRHEWITRSNNENPPAMHHYPFEWLSKNLEKDYNDITFSLLPYAFFKGICGQKVHINEQCTTVVISITDIRLLLWHTLSACTIYFMVMPVWYTIFIII
jgi:hypothetical protein